MAVTKPRPLTKFDYWQLPEAGPRYQLINGDLHMAPAPNRFHQDISRTIEFEILKYLEREPRGIIYDAPFDVILTDLNVPLREELFFWLWLRRTLERAQRGNFIKKTQRARS